MNTLTELGERVIEAEKQRDQYKAERDTLIDDIAVLRANEKRLERHNEALKYNENCLWRSSREFELERDELEYENKQLKCKDKAFDKYIAEVRERVKITVNTEDEVEEETQKIISYFIEDKQND